MVTKPLNTAFDAAFHVLFISLLRLLGTEFTVVGDYPW